MVQKIQRETEIPNPEQMRVLEIVKDRLLKEVEFENMLPNLTKGDTITLYPTKEKHMQRLCEDSCTDYPEQEKVQSLHGSCGCLKKLEVTKMVPNLFVAFQNRVAHKMKGSTLHQAGDVGVAEKKMNVNCYTLTLICYT